MFIYAYIYVCVYVYEYMCPCVYLKNLKNKNNWQKKYDQKEYILNV